MKEKPIPQTLPFSHPVELEELLAQQRLAPVGSLDELSALWPGQEDPDELLGFILAEREARRHARPRQG